MVNDFIELPANKASLARRKLVHGVGINDADYIVKPTIKLIRTACPYYTTWEGMLSRCYSRRMSDKHRTYKDCYVCKEWLLFSVFKKWMITQEWHGLEIDKDIKIPDNKIYSPSTCLFVSSSLNTLFNKNKSSRGKYPIGVYFYKRTGKFKSQCRTRIKKVSLGYHETIEEARLAYVNFKNSIIEREANLPINKKIKIYILNHMELNENPLVKGNE